MMTDARADAVEVAALALINQDRRRFELPPHATPTDAFDQGQKAMGIATIAIGAYLATMAAAGWVMVRDVGGMTFGDAAKIYPVAQSGGTKMTYIRAWNACRAAMLADPSPER